MNNNECKFCSEHEEGDTLYECNGWDGGVSYDYIQDIKYCPLCGRKLGGVESLPSENQNGDTINRQVAIDLLSMIEFEHAVCCLNIWYKGIDDDMEEALEMAIKALKQQTGRWIDTGSGQECSNCHEIQCGYDNYRLYCANCGSRNEVVKE